jgi:hypothetical protein
MTSSDWISVVEALRRAREPSNLSMASFAGGHLATLAGLPTTRICVHR